MRKGFNFSVFLPPIIFISLSSVKYSAIMIVFPNAKINIGLFVTEKREDGFHNLETVFYPIGLSDILEINPAEGEIGSCFFEQTGIDVGCEAEKNLTVKAYRLLAADYSLPAVRMHLHKVIPFGAGLGGGSSDAAFALKTLDECFGLSLTVEQLEAYAARLGSDCAFFVRNRPAFAGGKGEVLEPVEMALDDYRLVLVKPPFGVSTPEAYAGITPRAADFDLHRLPGVPLECWRGQVRNDFEEHVFRLYPRLAAIKEQLYASGASYASMTGSGSAVYGLFPREAEIALDCPDCFVWQEDK